MPTPRQLALLHVAVQRVGLDETAYRALLAGVGVQSGRDLSNPQLDQVMQALRSLGFRDGRPRRAPLGARPGMATDAQLASIRALWEDWSGRVDDEASLQKWAARFGVSALRFLDHGRAQKAIGALRNMLRRRAARADAR